MGNRNVALPAAVVRGGSDETLADREAVAQCVEGFREIALCDQYIADLELRRGKPGLLVGTVRPRGNQFSEQGAGFARASRLLLCVAQDFVIARELDQHPSLAIPQFGGGPAELPCRRRALPPTSADRPSRSAARCIFRPAGPPHRRYRWLASGSRRERLHWFSAAARRT